MFRCITIISDMQYILYIKCCILINLYVLTYSYIFIFYNIYIYIYSVWVFTVVDKSTPIQRVPRVVDRR